MATLPTAERLDAVRKFFVTAWAITTVIGMTSLAHADPEKRDWWFEGAAQFLFWDGTRNLIGDGVGSIEPDNGYGLFLEGGYHQPDGPWSASFGAKYGESGNSSESVNSISSGGLIFLGTDTVNEEEFIRLDAMAGYDVDPGNVAGCGSQDHRRHSVPAFRRG